MSMSIYVRSKSPQNIGFPPHVEQVSMLTNKGRTRKPRGRRPEGEEKRRWKSQASTRPAQPGLTGNARPKLKLSASSPAAR